MTEWRRLTDGNIPNHEPFHAVVRRQDGRIALDQDALLAIGPEQMYAWHEDVLDRAGRRG